MFVVFSLTKFRVISTSGSLFVAIRPRPEDKIATTAMLLFYIPKKLTKCAYCIKIYYFACISGTRSGAADSWLTRSPVHHVIIGLLHVGNWWAGSSVGIATELRAGRSGIESRWGRDIPPAQTGPGAHPASCKMGTGSFPGVKCCRGVLLTTRPLLVPRSWKSRAIPLPTLWTTPGL